MNIKKIILDTDIGDDIDDIWTLVYFLACPEFDIKLVSVTSGDTNYKAKLVSSILHRCGRDDIPIVAGESSVMEVKPQNRWVESNKYFRTYSLDYQGVMKATIEENKDATIVLIGPINDFGKLINNNPGLIRNMDVVFMGGSIYRGYENSKEISKECNVTLSIDGSRTLLNSGANVTLLPLDVNSNIVIKGQKYKMLKQSPYKYAKVIMENYHIWQEDYCGGAKKFDIEKQSSYLFDLSTVFYLLNPYNYICKELPVVVDDEGYTRISENDKNIKVAIKVKNPNLNIKEFLKRILLLKSKRNAKVVLRDNWRMILLALPTIIIVGIFAYAPMFGVLIAFQDFSPGLGFFKSDWIGFENFKSFFESPSFAMVLRNTLIVSLYSLAVNTIVPIFLALLINEVANEKFKRFFQLFSYAPYFISLVVLVGMFNSFLGSQGFINKIIEWCGGDGVDFLTSEQNYYSVYVWTGLWAGCGWWSIIYVNALGAIPKDIIEASAIDGASRFKRIIYINLPYIKSTILTLFILAVGGIMSLGFEKTLLMQNALNYNSSEFISSYTYTVSFVKSQDFSYGTAVGLFNSVVNCVLLITANFLSKRLANKSLI